MPAKPPKGENHKGDYLWEAERRGHTQAYGGPNCSGPLTTQGEIRETVQDWPLAALAYLPQTVLFSSP